MPASPISKRQPLPRNLQDYVLNYEKSPEAGLFPIDSKLMEYVPGAAGSSGAIDQSETLDIGFTFSFDNIDYQKIYVNTNGWAVLLDPTQVVGTFTVGDVLTGTQDQNETIKIQFVGPSGGPINHTLLAPWFDSLQSVYRSADDAAALIGSASLVKIKLGEMLVPRIINSSTGGLKFYRGDSFSGGRCFVVRWNSFILGSTSLHSVTFDLVIYENGKIEFRYAPISFSEETIGSATIGVFGYGGIASMSGPETARYRDFGYLIKRSNLDIRQIYKNGGTAGSPFSNYVMSDLAVNNEWPASPMGEMGAIFHFSPPVNHRHVTRRDIPSNDDGRLSTGGLFDDRKSIVYGQTETTSFPVGLPTNYVIRSQHHGASGLQDLIGSCSLEVDRQILPSMFDSFIVNNISDAPEDGFMEVNLSEQGRSSEAFFATGSSIYMGEPGSLSSQLMNKAIFRLTLPVKNPVQMFATSCSIYYYNRSHEQWNIPSNAIGEVCDPFDKFAFNTEGDPVNWGLSPQGYTPGSVIFEDYKGFDPYGHAVASGSLDIFRQVTVPGNRDRNQTILGIGHINRTNGEIVEILQGDYVKSLQRNASYVATADEVFSLPIERPFLLEKATFEVPLAMGNTWFQDRTATVRTFHSGTSQSGGTHSDFKSWAFDKGGPALTVALFCQKNLGLSSILDLIMTGTITHVSDSIRRVDSRQSLYQDLLGLHVTSIGLPEASAIVNPDFVWMAGGSNYFFTGSVVINSQAAASNGVNSALFNAENFSGTGNPANDVIIPDIKELITSRIKENLLSYDSDSDFYTTILGVDPFGRGMTGFNPSGGSIFGREFATYDGNTKRDTILNPFFVSGSVDYSIDSGSFISTIDDFLNTNYPTAPYPNSVLGHVYSIANIDFGSSRPSPYLLHPGDKLVLSISKTRPAISGSKFTMLIAPPGPANADIGKVSLDSYSYFTGSMDGHDVLLNTGSINMSFYGSYIRGNGGYVK